MRILAVDDDQHFLDLLEAVLGEAGYDDVTCVGSAPDALTEAYHAEGKIDCFLLDVQMPDMDGLEATRLLRQRESAGRRHTPIIAMTAHASDQDRTRCLDAGMDDYVSKPLRSELLIQALDRTVRPTRTER